MVSSTPSPHPPAPDLTVAQPRVSSLEAQKIANLEAQIAALEHQIADVTAQEEEIRAKLKSSHPAATTVRTHIRLLHTYNETRDMATGLMGIIADSRGVRSRDVHEEFGVEEAN